MTKQGTYTRIPEVKEIENGHVVPADSRSTAPTKVVQLRNVAYTKSASGPLTRAQVLEALVPLSRVPWSTVPTLIRDQSDKTLSNSTHKAGGTIGGGSN